MNRLPPLEPDAWRATADLIDLPDDLTDLCTRHDRLTRERDDLPQPPVIPSAADATAGGTPYADAIEAQRTAEEAATDLADQRRALTDSIRAVKFLTRKWIGDHRDELIGDRLRPAVDHILDQAVPAADQLEPYAPTFDPTAIARQADDEQLTAWRTLSDLHDQFAVLVNAWTRSWAAATAAAGGRDVPGHLTVDAPGGVHTWQRPHAVDDPDVRDGRDRRLVSIARWHHAGHYRLATTAEVVELDRRYILVHPQVGWERTQRRVHLPDGRRRSPAAS